MKNLVIGTTQTLSGSVLFKLDEDIPNELAQFCAAILSTANPLNDNGYNVETVVLSRGLFPTNEVQTGEYSRDMAEIRIDVDKCVEGAVLLDDSNWEIRYLCLRAFTIIMAHEAIHSCIKDELLYEVEEELVLSHQMKLLNEAMNLWDINANKDLVDFFRPAILTAIEKHGMYRLKNHIDDVVVFHDTSSGEDITSWRELFQLLDIAPALADDLFELPAIVSGDFEEKSAEAPKTMTAGVGSTQAQEISQEPAFAEAAPYEFYDQFDPSWIDDDYDYQNEIMDTEDVPSTPAPPAPSAPVNQPVQTNPLDGLVVFFQALMLRCYENIYAKCGWDGHGKFIAPGNVISEPVYIGDLPGKSLLHQYHTTDAHGRPMINSNIENTITGVPTKGGLPMYHVVLNFQGRFIPRKLVPQNPDKMKTNGELKWTSEAVRRGEKLAWIFDAETSKFTYKISNGTMTKLK